MTDLEISKALALAIGWERIETLKNIYKGNEEEAWVRQTHHDSNWKAFDYCDWAVAGPIAEKYDCFPFKDSRRGWTTEQSCMYADTPQKAIALTVIDLTK